MIASPIRFISSALPGPTRRGSRWVPPKPGMIPSLISGWPKIAESAAIRKSQAIASSQPPPNAIELTAATVEIRLDPELAQQRVAGVDQLLAAGLVHLRERLDVGARREHETGHRGVDDHRADLALGVEPVPDRLQVLDHLRRDRVHRRVREPGDRDVAAGLDLDRVGLVAVVGLRVGVEALARLEAEAALGDQALQDPRRREALAVRPPRASRASRARCRGPRGRPSRTAGRGRGAGRGRRRPSSRGRSRAPSRRPPRAAGRPRRRPSA